VSLVRQASPPHDARVEDAIKVPAKYLDPEGVNGGSTYEILDVSQSSAVTQVHPSLFLSLPPSPFPSDPSLRFHTFCLCLCLYLYRCLCLYQCFCVSVFPCLCLSLSVSLSVKLSVFVSLCLFLCRCLNIFLSPSLCLSHSLSFSRTYPQADPASKRGNPCTGRSGRRLSMSPYCRRTRRMAGRCCRHMATPRTNRRWTPCRIAQRCNL